MHVFISYSHSDIDFIVKELIPKLDEAGVGGWVDSEKLRAGEDWRQGIDEAINRSFAVVIIVTPQSKKSEYVTYEWAYAIGARKTVVPILLNLTELHPRLEALQYYDFTRIWNAPWDKLIDQLTELQNNQRSLEVPLYVQRAIDDLDSYLPETRKTAVAELSKMEYPSAQEALRRAMDNSAEDVRIAAIFSLAESNDDNCIPYLVDLIKKTRYLDIRRRGIKALTKMEGEKPLKILLEMFQDADCSLLEYAVEGLKELGWQPSTSTR